MLRRGAQGLRTRNGGRGIAERGRTRAPQWSPAAPEQTRPRRVGRGSPHHRIVAEFSGFASSAESGSEGPPPVALDVLESPSSGRPPEAPGQNQGRRRPLWHVHREAQRNGRGLLRQRQEDGRDQGPAQDHDEERQACNPGHLPCLRREGNPHRSLAAPSLGSTATPALPGVAPCPGQDRAERHTRSACRQPASQAPRSEQTSPKGPTGLPGPRIPFARIGDAPHQIPSPARFSSVSTACPRARRRRHADTRGRRGRRRNADCPRSRPTPVADGPAAVLRACVAALAAARDGARETFAMRSSASGSPAQARWIRGAAWSCRRPTWAPGSMTSQSRRSSAAPGPARLPRS
jgi:hypothetical protein